MSFFNIAFYLLPTELDASHLKRDSIRFPRV
jgi:hypothetical protein